MPNPAITPPRKRVTRKQYKNAYRVYLNYATSICLALASKYPHLEFRPDPIVALNVAIATYDDIDRFKAYHLHNDGSSRSDVVKRAAYFTRWTSKLRPIMIFRADPAPVQPPAKDLGLLVNETLAVAFALELISSETGRDIKLSSKAHSELLYDLHYRDMGSDALLAFFQIVTDLVRAQKQNPIVEFSIA